MTDLQYGQQPVQSFAVCFGSKIGLHIGLSHFITVRQRGTQCLQSCHLRAENSQRNVGENS